MKKTIIYSFVIMVILIIAYVSYNIWLASKYTVRLKTFVIRKFNGTNITGFLMVYVYNPSDFRVFVEKYEGIIYMDGVKAVNFSGNTNLLIEPKKEFVLQMDYAVNPKELLTLGNISQIFQQPGTIITSKGNITLRTLNGKVITVPFIYSDSLQNILD